MNNTDISTKNEVDQKESSSDDQLDSPSTSYYFNKFQKILLDIDEKPDVIIEKILINIFNRFISPDNNESENFDFYICQKKIKILTIKHEKYQIIYFLLTKIRSLINKYREKIFELQNIIELKEKFFKSFNQKSQSPNGKISKNYIDFGIDRIIITHRSIPKMKKIFDYYTTVKSLFCELKNIKNCLEKTAPIIEKIFEIPLSDYEKFSIYECEKEDYLRILIHDDFIWNEIIKNRNTHLSDIIKEITEDDNKNITLMSKKISYFHDLIEYKQINIDEMLKISKIGSSIDTRFPEDAKPVAEIRYKINKYYDNNTEINNINYFPFNEEPDLDESTNLEEQNTNENNDSINNIDDSAIYNINKIKETLISTNKSKEKNKNDISNNSPKITNNINIINIKEDNNYIDIPNLLKNNETNNKDNFPKSIPLNNAVFRHKEINQKIEKNINNINFEKAKLKLLKNKEKLLKNKKEIKKEIINENKHTKTNKKIDKKEIPSDIDDLVKYIVNDDKTETQNKKKKKNKRKNKKNKNEIKAEKEEEKLNIEEKKEKEENDEFNEIKNNIINNSINRFKIHKIKFKYRPQWLEKISNYP